MQKMGIFPSHFIVLCLCSISTHFKVWICDLFFFAFRNKAKAFICVFIFLLFAVLYWLPLQVSHPALPSAICAKPEGIGTKWNLVLFDRTRDNKLQNRKSWLAIMGGKKPQFTEAMRSPSLEINCMWPWTARSKAVQSHFESGDRTRQPPSLNYARNTTNFRKFTQFYWVTRICTLGALLTS